MEAPLKMLYMVADQSVLCLSAILTSLIAELTGLTSSNLNQPNCNIHPLLLPSKCELLSTNWCVYGVYCVNVYGGGSLY